MHDLQGQFFKDPIFRTSLVWGEVKKETLQKSWRKLWPDITPESNETSSIETIIFGLVTVIN